MALAHLGRFSLTTRKPALRPRFTPGVRSVWVKGAQTLPGMRIPNPVHEANPNSARRGLVERQRETLGGEPAQVGFLLAQQFRHPLGDNAGWR